MAWALKDPDGFGKYWPLGSFKGWSKQVEAYVHNEMPEERKAQVYEDGSFSMWQMACKFYKDKGPVDSKESPTNFQTEKSYTELHSMIETESQLIAVDEALKQLIEQFEPGVHQFFPFIITMPKGKIFSKQYYVLLIRQFIEGFILVEGTFRESGQRPNYYPVDGNKTGYNQIHVSKAAIGEAHLWRDTRMTHPNVFISDALQAAIKDAGLTILRHHKVKED